MSSGVRAKTSSVSYVRKGAPSNTAAQPPTMIDLPLAESSQGGDQASLWHSVFGGTGSRSCALQEFKVDQRRQG